MTLEYLEYVIIRREIYRQPHGLRRVPDSWNFHLHTHSIQAYVIEHSMTTCSIRSLFRAPINFARCQYCLRSPTTAAYHYHSHQDFHFSISQLPNVRVRQSHNPPKTRRILGQRRGRNYFLPRPVSPARGIAYFVANGCSFCSPRNQIHWFSRAGLSSPHSIFQRILHLHFIFLSEPSQLVP